MLFDSAFANEPIDLDMDDDVRKLERLQLINASARYELMTANQQLIDFHLNRVMKAKARKLKQKTGCNDTIIEQLDESYNQSARQIYFDEKTAKPETPASENSITGKVDARL